MRETVINAIEKEKIIAIARNLSVEDCVKAADALYEGGIRLVEVTFNLRQPDSYQQTADAIAAIRAKYEGRMLVGAGTVTYPELVDIAASGGAQYIISPDTNEAVIRRTRELGLVSIPGAMTPTEIMTAHRLGADFVKLFPSADLGVSYIKSIKAPISHVKLLATGGINENNVADYLNLGMAGAGVGGNLVSKKWIESNELEKITETARKIVAAAQGC